jgi:hypothetical protein
MHSRNVIGAVMAAAVLVAATGALAFDDAKYPDLKGLWTRARVPGAVGQPPHDPSRPPGRGQGAPLTPEYQARFEANLVDQARGGQGTSATFTCLPNGMPRMMSAYEPIEFVVTPDITYVLIDHIEHSRHVYTDGRDWPKAIEPTWVGYSIGKWIDEDGDRLQGAACLRSQRPTAARGQSEHLQGAHLARQGRPRPPARRDHHHRSCTDAAVDSDQELPPQFIPAGGMARMDLRGE